MVAVEPLTGDKAYVTAWLDNSRTDILKVFRCNACGAPMFKYYDSLKLIIPGRADTGGNPRIIQCRGRFESLSSIGRTFSASCKLTYWIYSS